MRDDGAEEAKASIAGTLDSFLDDESPPEPANTNTPLMTVAGPVGPCVPATAAQN